MGLMSSQSDKVHIPPFWMRHFKLLGVIGVVLSSITLFVGLLLIERETRETAAIREASNYIRAIESLRTLYTKSVVEPLTKQGIVASHKYREDVGSIPLPATLSMELGADIAEKSGKGFSFRLFSDYPFPWRMGGGPRDVFQRQALTLLSRNPEKPFYRIETYDGVKILRFAKADLMREACIDCHNNHPQTPRTGWKVGDVRGVLETSVPLYGSGDDENRALKIAYIALIFFITVLCILLVIIGRVIDKQLQVD